MFDSRIKLIPQHLDNFPWVILIVGGNPAEGSAAAAEHGNGYACVHVHTINQIPGHSVVGAVILDVDLYTNEMRMALRTAMLTALSAPLGLYYEDLIAVDHKRPRWRCRTCNATRRVNPCWKCNTSMTDPIMTSWVDPFLPDFQLIRKLGREVGYAIAQHGSLENDLDIVAVPWTTDSVSAQALVDHLVKGLKNDNGEARQMPNHLELRPHGRLSVNIKVNGWYKMIDLSITPTLQED